MDTHIFVATGNNSGSTFLLNLLSLCKNVVTFPRKEIEGGYVIDEGQHVSGTMPQFKLSEEGLIWTEVLDQISDNSRYSWDETRNSWEDQWGKHSNYYRGKWIILVEKSPHNLGRVNLLKKEFENPWFLTQVRNPYVVAEGVRRRMGKSKCNIRRAGTHAIKMLELAKVNLSTCDQLLTWRYEDLFTKPHIIQNMITESIFGLEDFSLGKIIPSKKMDGYENSKLSDQNPRQWDNLSDKDIRILNEVFDEHSNTMMFFNYERMT
jgi:hypothetical protein